MRLKFYNNFRLFLNRKRFILLCGSIFFIFIFLVLRLTYLQIICSKQLVIEGDFRSLRMQNIPVVRGNITDRRGRLLATSLPAYAIYLDPQEINNSGGISNDIYHWTILSNILSISLDKLLIMTHNHNRERFLYLARQLDPEISQYINELKLPGIYLKQELKRYYPDAHVVAQLIGVTNVDSQGIEGVEKTFNSCLTGRSGSRIIRKDRKGKVIEDVTLICGQSAQNIVLSIDERLQCIAYRELNNAVHLNKAESGSIVLIDINTGEILAIANSPSYDPNNLSNVDPSVMRNRAITDAFEPGSTIKPIVVMTALQYNIIDSKETIINTSPYMINGHQIKDVVSHDTLTIKEILQKSSNVGVSKLALSMPVNALMKAYSKFGIGHATNIGLIGESSGKYLCNKNLSDLERATLSYGYGLMITPLQLAKIYATIGGMGVSRPLSIIKIDSPVLGEQVFPRSLVRAVVDMLEHVILLDAEGCQFSDKRLDFAIKTGTVKKVGKHGKYINKYIAYTAGVAPVNNPRLALVVMINDPKNGRYYGNAVSTPVFKVVMHHALRIIHMQSDLYNGFKK